MTVDVPVMEQSKGTKAPEEGQRLRRRISNMWQSAVKRLKSDGKRKESNEVCEVNKKQVSDNPAPDKASNSGLTRTLSSTKESFKRAITRRISSKDEAVAEEKTQGGEVDPVYSLLKSAAQVRQNTGPAHSCCMNSILGSDGSSRQESMSSVCSGDEAGAHSSTCTCACHSHNAEALQQCNIALYKGRKLSTSQKT